MELKDKICLVTGGSGIIGSHIIKALLEERAEVINLDIRDAKFEGVESINVDVRDFQKLNEVFQNRNIDIVFHEAAQDSIAKAVQDPAFDFDVNVKGTLNLLIFSRDYDAEKFIFASSAAVYGSLQYSPVDEKHPTNPLTPFGAGKLAAEKYLYSFYHTYGLKTVILRYFNVYSSKLEQSKLVIGTFVNNFLKNERSKLYAGGDQKRDFVHVEDVTRANILAAKAEASAGETFNIGTGKTTSIKELYYILRDLFGSSLEPIYETGTPERYAYVADISNAKRLLEYSPRINLLEGLKKLVQDCKNV